MPTARRGLGGLGFLRSRSAPPVPRDPETDFPPVDEKAYPVPHVEIDGHDPGRNQSQGVDATSATSVGNPWINPSPPSAGARTSMSTLQPVAPIEAVLLGRGRRPVTSSGVSTMRSSSASGAAGTVGASVDLVTVPARVATGLGKNSKFKSSPLGDVERIGTVVVEKVNDDMNLKEGSGGDEEEAKGWNGVTSM